MIIKGYKYRLSPNKWQQVLLEKHFGATRWIFNYGLRKKVEEYQKHKKNLSCFQISKELPILKGREDTEWLKEINAQSLQMSLRNLDNAYTNFFKKRNKFPKFKSKKNKNSFTISQHNRVNFKNSKAFFLKLGYINIIIDREFNDRIVKATISKNNINQYFVSYTVEETINAKKLKKIKEKTTIGIDLGIKHFAILSNGEKIENPKLLIKSEKRLAILQRRLSKKKKNSKNSIKAKFRVSKIYNKISNQRSDFLHNLTSKLINDNQVDTYAIENLNINGMLKNHCLAKSISDVSWGEFVRQLTYKCEWYGKNLITIGRFEPSSKMCSCGYINKELKLSDREWTCPECKAVHDRDILASNNIKKFALSPLNKKNREVVSRSVCGAVAIAKH